MTSSNKKYRNLPEVDCSYGAPMGRPNVLPDMIETHTPKLQLLQLPFVDGGYDPGGAYWGNPGDGSNVFWAYVLWLDKDPCHIFAWARSRDEAKAKIRQIIPKARFRK